MMIIFLAALQDIPSSVYEAAAVDGATALADLPAHNDAHAAADDLLVVTLGLIGTYQVFDQIYVMSSGGPCQDDLTMAHGLSQRLPE